MSLTKRYDDIRVRIEQAATRSNRDANEVTLIAVTKTVGNKTIGDASKLGINNFGENRVQEALPKIEQLPFAKWHFIGHLQSNKVKYIIDKVAMVHSLDRLSLAKELQKRAQKVKLQMPVLIQVNVAQEDSKFGLATTEVLDFCHAISKFPNIAVKGLMTMAPYVECPETVRHVFANLRKLRDDVAAASLPHIRMQHLSMGMSNDFEVAIEEGATMVRIGSALFGERR